jgi:hypothetical protein
MRAPSVHTALGLYSHWEASPADLLTGRPTYFLNLMFSHDQSYLRQIMHLSAFLELSGYARQRLLAASTDQRTTPYYLIWIGHLHERVPRRPRSSSRRVLAAVTRASRLALGTDMRGRFADVVAVFGQLAFQPLQSFGQLGDLLVGLS